MLTLNVKITFPAQTLIFFYFLLTLCSVNQSPPKKSIAILRYYFGKFMCTEKKIIKKEKLKERESKSEKREIKEKI